MSRILETSRFGELQIETEAVISFPKGIPGFETYKEWVIAGDDENPIKWLQSVTDVDTALPVISPQLVVQNYNLQLAPEDLTDIEGDFSKITVMVIVTIPPSAPWEMTANLRAPVVVNHEKRLAKQIISQNEEYLMRTPVLPQSVREMMKKKAAGGEK
ncbi:flagellar assembly protein FliW [Aminobacterium sp. MB27-C1]|jgi:flagellar assembly factor FliW|uniref:flagellar assembly protein FliW n=1 Tax=unclassified Aminobacterium TaxID=2685012 RepID=UPI0027DCBA34|nr:MULTISPECIES: flagellar assembly protein FliW [unclassified Aminobacterium]MEA4878069.1 flagellar assembly protein FliW [Aminobacterium sp.]WMI72644.1 flagellar assembly protein FliW [Aminobacterium sp. MB27-C1]